MAPRITHLNHLSAAKMADLSATNEKRLRCIDSATKNGSEAILARLPNRFKSEWHLWAEPANKKLSVLALALVFIVY
jgi:hypothetical protein